jgi:hypothetical protein
MMFRAVFWVVLPCKMIVDLINLNCIEEMFLKGFVVYNNVILTRYFLCIPLFKTED